ncbi:MAG: hypothetical protein AAF587_42235 [Bacteroidota bacterium]
MRVFLIFSWLICWQCVQLFGQTIPLFEQEALRKVSLPESASQLLVDEEGNLLILDTENARLSKYIANTKFDSTLTIGGQSNRQEGFLHPIRISQKNRLNLYLLDDVQRRIVLLTINFKVVQEVNFNSLVSRLENLGEESEIFPLSFDINPAGEVFMLNQFDNKVLKINNFGDIEAVFGGLDYGEGSLYDPVELAVSDQNWVFVSDTTAQEIKVFDAYGVFRYTFQPAAPFRWKKFILSASRLICYDETHFHIEHLSSKEFISFSFPSPNRIRDLALNGSFFYVLLENGVSLQENSVHLYRLTP